VWEMLDVQRQDWLDDSKAERLRIMRGAVCDCARWGVCDARCLLARNSVLCVPNRTCLVVGDCGNRFPAYTEAGMMECFEVRETGLGKGGGLFTLRPYKSGVPLLLYNGPIVRRETEEKKGNAYLCETYSAMFYNRGKTRPNVPKGERVVMDGRGCWAGACNHECGHDTSCVVREKWIYVPASTWGLAAVREGGTVYPVSVLCAAKDLPISEECVWNYDEDRAWSNCKCRFCSNDVVVCGSGEFGETIMAKGGAIKIPPKKNAKKKKRRVLHW
jgi:hypothetical protein